MKMYMLQYTLLTCLNTFFTHHMNACVEVFTLHNKECQKSGEHLF